jgi:hypothetical protein
LIGVETLIVNQERNVVVVGLSQQKASKTAFKQLLKTRHHSTIRTLHRLTSHNQQVHFLHNLNKIDVGGELFVAQSTQ